jgi:hypothetical protein
VTQDKTLKGSVSARMEATGEPYDVARRNVLAERGVVDDEPERPEPSSAGTDAWRRVPWNAPLSAYYVTRDVDGQEADRG